MLKNQKGQKKLDFLTIAAACTLFLALAYLIMKSVLSNDTEIDFRYLWTAGQMWSEGSDPYSPTYFNRGAELFPQGIIISYWFYPPQWWLICRPLALLSVDQGLVIWRTINAILVISCMWFLVRTFSRNITPIPNWAAMFLISIPAAMTSTAQTLAMGQTSIIIFAGYCLFSAGLISFRLVPLTLGLVLLMLKPQFGIPAVASLILIPRFWVALVAAGALSVAMAFPQLLEHGIVSTLAGLARNASIYGHYSQNGPMNMSGLSHISAQLFGQGISAILASILAAGTILGTTFFILRQSWTDTHQKVIIAITVIAFSALFIPLHNYDFVIIAPIAVLAVALGPLPRIITLTSVLIAMRIGTVLNALNAPNSAEPLLLTVCASLVVLALVLNMFAVRNFPKGTGNNS